ncbi:DUF3844 domain-containing protein [Mycena sanguinolenta]|uniref:DUF3844 domain-containing protein n=1 Tax=Mycena sanguinolenta TaxID=230812 RepID=A0A8H6Y434_9AGAR|nr:DUF3844 domain-containing protein [Mycena sanguinolenta]
MLLDLSVELLQEIGRELTQTEQAVLRSVCKGLNDSVGPLFFSILDLKHKQKGVIQDTVQKLRILAKGGTGWSLHAKTLRIIQVMQRHNISLKAHLDAGELASLLAGAFAALPRIKTFVLFDVDPNFWECVQGAIWSFLNSLESLHELELIDIPRTIDLSALRNNGGSSEIFDMLSPSPIAQFISQNQLISLHVEGPTGWSPIWGMLRSKIPLTEMTTNLVTQELLHYLTSCFGLKKLILRSPDGGNLNVSNRLADTFFGNVLPGLAESLTELSCVAAHESRFSFGTHNVHVVLLLRNLTQLEMSVNGGRVERSRAGSTTHVDPNGTTHIIYPMPICSPSGMPAEAEQADITPVVTLLLQTAASLPALRRLGISAAEAEHQRGVWWGNKLNHIGAVNSAIVNAVEGFRADVPCSVVVCAGGYAYELREVTQASGSVKEGRLGYEQLTKVGPSLYPPPHFLTSAQFEQLLRLM